MTAPHLDPTRRHDAVILFDVTDGNPNGDPDLGKQPRTDDETGHGLVTDVSIKRKIRDTVPLLHPDDPRYGIFVEAGQALTPRWTQLRETADAPEAAVCSRFWDVRMFGQVLTAGKHGGTASIRGPVQLTFARSLDPVLPVDHTITRVTQARQEDVNDGHTGMGDKWTVPYGLYRANLYFSASRAANTGVTSDDLETLWHSITMMFDHTRSSQRGGLDLTGLWVFSHPTALGVAPARALLRRVKIARGGDTDKSPRHWTDYHRELSLAGLPAGVEVTAVYDIWEEA